MTKFNFSVFRLDKTVSRAPPCSDARVLLLTGQQCLACLFLLVHSKALVLLNPQEFSTFCDDCSTLVLIYLLHRQIRKRKVLLIVPQFRDNKHGEWYGYLNEEGKLTHRFKGGPFKGKISSWFFKKNFFISLNASGYLQVLQPKKALFPCFLVFPHVSGTRNIVFLISHVQTMY